MQIVILCLQSICFPVAMDVKAATKATLQDRTMLTVTLAAGDELHLPLKGEDSTDALDYFGQEDTKPIAEIEIAENSLTIIGRGGELCVSVHEDAADHHNDVFAKA